jgi:hypothetical protein
MGTSLFSCCLRGPTGPDLFPVVPLEKRDVLDLARRWGREVGGAHPKLSTRQYALGTTSNRSGA